MVTFQKKLILSYIVAKIILVLLLFEGHNFINNVSVV